jgi:putative hydrolase of the HAD superfamily
MKEMLRTILLELHEQKRRRLEPYTPDIPPAVRALCGVKAILFDIYGTLLISGSGDVGTAISVSRKEAFKDALISAGVQEPEESIVDTAETLFFSEISKRHSISHTRGIKYPEVDILSVWESVFHGLSLDLPETGYLRAAMSYEVNANPVCIMPEAIQTIGKLRNAGFHLGIVSNAQAYTKPLLEYELGTSLEEAGFEARLCSYSYVVGEAKPSAAIFHPVLTYLANHYGIQTSQTLYVGNDMLNDIYAAGVQGMLTCLFAGDRRSLRLREDNELCRDSHPDVRITHLSQIIRVVSP